MTEANITVEEFEPNPTNDNFMGLNEPGINEFLYLDKPDIECFKKLTTEDQKQYDFVLDTMLKGRKPNKKANISNRKEYMDKGNYDKYFYYRVKDSDDIEHKNYLSKSCKENFENYINKALNLKISDPDSGGSMLLQKLLFTLYPKLLGNAYIGNTVFTDTMNSVQTTLNCISTLYVKNNTKNLSEIYLVQNIPSEGTRLNAICLAANNENRNYFDYLDTFLVLKNLMLLTHTIGNYIPVPDGFNSGRSSRTKDYWDLTLLGIYKYYQAEGENTKRKELKKILADKAIDNTINWLDSFKTWNKFVEDTYMKPFLGKDGKPEPLFTGHFDEKHVLPKDEKEINEFLEKATTRIIKRGELMINKLNKANS